jgi:hypothetical protein
LDCTTKRTRLATNLRPFGEDEGFGSAFGFLPKTSKDVAFRISSLWSRSRRAQFIRALAKEQGFGSVFGFLPKTSADVAFRIGSS